MIDLATWDRALLEAPWNPFADPVVRLDAGLTLPPHVETLHSAVRRELHRAVDGVASTGAAAMLLVVGDPGQGKTHELARLRAEVRSCHWLEIPPLKDAGAPFQHILRYTAQGLLLHGGGLFMWEALARVARAVRDDAQREGDESTIAALDAVLLGDLRFVNTFRALVREDPELGELLSSRGRALPPLLGLDADFARVLGRIPDRNVESLALDWLRGAELPDDDLFLLGIRRALDSEERCYEVLRALASLSPRPLALCFDQLESTSGQLGPAGSAALFTALMDLYQSLPVCIVLMCQVQVWGELAPQLPKAAFDRIRELPPLRGPTPVEAERLVASRLAGLWASADAPPPYPTYPFPTSWLTAFVTENNPSARRVLSECGGRLDAMRARGGIEQPAGPVRARPAAPPDVAATLAEEHARKLRIVVERADLATPKLRQDPVRNAVGHLLQGAVKRQRKIAGARVAAVDVPSKPRSGPRAPMLLTVELPRGGLARVALEVHGDDARGAVHVLERLRERVDGGAADVGLMVREVDAPLGAGAKRTQALIHSLEPRGGVLWVEATEAHRLVAAELLLDAASAAEVWAGDRTASREDALAFLLEHQDLDAIIAPLVSRVGLLEPKATAVRAPLGDDLGERVLGVLRSVSPIMSAARVAAALGTAQLLLEPAIATLERGGRINVALDRDGAKTLLLRGEGSR